MCALGVIFSSYFKLTCGIRQGGVLSPYLFSVYVDSVIDKVKHCSFGCYVKSCCLSILMYADDILLIAPSVNALQIIFKACEDELVHLDMPINVSKTACIRIGPDNKAIPVNIETRNDLKIEWTDKLRYLGIYLVRARKFSCCTENAKRSFYRSFNSIFGKVGRIASEEVVVQLVKSKCIPLLTYGLEACKLTKSQMKSLDNAVDNSIVKIFNVKAKENIRDCKLMFNITSTEETINKRREKFLASYAANSVSNLVRCAFCVI